MPSNQPKAVLAEVKQTTTGAGRSPALTPTPTDSEQDKTAPTAPQRAADDAVLATPLLEAREATQTPDHGSSADANAPEPRAPKTPLPAGRVPESDEIRTQGRVLPTGTKPAAAPVTRMRPSPRLSTAKPGRKRQRQESSAAVMQHTTKTNLIKQQDKTKKLERPQPSLQAKKKNPLSTCSPGEDVAALTVSCPLARESPYCGRTKQLWSDGSDATERRPADTYWSSKWNAWVIDLTK
ncbi:hypothetical protein PR003_g6541 [Phytophthora rubi]|uniref:Uncharacterized protein n=1 Tax=Phytophthora rubi TaxID=129364 RepID=A0A6A3LS49_9STRA|nr:hypothetical protein PR002_g21777 [Phytophthora rubi]KAE9018633.1 hypothetical protein PR001_g14087 [Phytophthora rubi]KAE9348183.1 hypothetical protein PR003_g6541 [Phytophthora rubi]